MKRLLLALLILLTASPLWAQDQVARMGLTVVGGGVPAAAGDPCATGTSTLWAYNQQESTGNARDFNTYTIGQTFTGAAAPFYSLSIYASGAIGTVTCRIGQAADLRSTYTDQVSITTGVAAGWYTGVSTTCPTLDTGTWYAICDTATDLGISWNIDDGPIAYPTSGWTTRNILWYQYSETAHALQTNTEINTRTTVLRIYLRQ
jgi:hypothetical protein